MKRIFRIYLKAVDSWQFSVLVLAGCIICAVVSLRPRPPQPFRYVPVIQLQRELVKDGYDIKCDGVFGKETDLALTKAIIKQRLDGAE